MNIIYPETFDANWYIETNPDLALTSHSDAENHYRQYGIREGRVGCKYSFRNEFIAYIKNFNAANVLEIGPACNPIFSGANVFYHDVMNVADIHIYAEHFHFSKENIPKTIHYYSPTADMSIIDQCFDLVFSSHNIEHQVDFLQHLRDVERITNQGGVYCLIIPDKRFCFDHYKPITTITDVLHDHYSRCKSKMHSMRTYLFTHLLNTHNNPVDHWKGVHGVPNAKRIREILDMFDKQINYTSHHAYFFSPNSFSDILETLYIEGFTCFKPRLILDCPKNKFEFCAILEKIT